MLSLTNVVAWGFIDTEEVKELVIFIFNTFFGYFQCSLNLVLT